MDLDQTAAQVRADDQHRRVDLERTGPSRYTATNARGGRISVGAGEGEEFTPVELLLAGLAGCSAVDIDLITGRRAEPTAFSVSAEGDKTRDDDGNHLTGLRVTFEVRFPEGEAGDRAREALPRALRQSADRLCTVGRTVQLASPVAYDLR